MREELLMSDQVMSYQLAVEFYKHLIERFVTAGGEWWTE